jgi:hypothetical protein
MERCDDDRTPAGSARPAVVGGYIPDDLYAQILSHVPIACVDLAIVSNGCVLLVQRTLT